MGFVYLQKQIFNLTLAQNQTFDNIECYLKEVHGYFGDKSI